MILKNNIPWLIWIFVLKRSLFYRSVLDIFGLRAVVVCLHLQSKTSGNMDDFADPLSRDN
jgi:hypothetical protein